MSINAIRQARVNLRQKEREYIIAKEHANGKMVKEGEKKISNGDIGKTSHNQFFRFVFIKTGLLMYNKSYETAKESINK